MRIYESAHIQKPTSINLIYGRWFPYMRIYERRLLYMQASVNAHLWKLDFVYVHICKCRYTKVDHFRICSFVEV
jgi:hypothetical protein